MQSSSLVYMSAGIVQYMTHKVGLENPFTTECEGGRMSNYSNSTSVL